MFKTVGKFLFPKIDKEVQSAVDARSLNNTGKTCWVIFLFEAVALLLFVVTRKEWDQSALVSIRSVVTCLILCLAGALGAGGLRKKENISHYAVAVFNALYYLLFSLWAVQVSVRNYTSNEQILTFFAVQLLMVCFLPLNPVHSISFAIIVYVVLYAAIYGIDKAVGINVFNYALLLIVTITGMIVRFFSQVRTAENSVELKRSNDLLFYNSRHDGLTGLRNRKALEEDVHKILNNPVTVYMIDINYFKEINDTYGHAVGDEVIKAAARWVRDGFGKDRCYRYGGDEFLILCEHGECYRANTATISVPEVTNREILISIGQAYGEPKDHAELFRLIARADGMLYEIKKRTHAAEHGGHGERIEIKGSVPI